MAIRLGIDLGGTKIELIALDADGTEVCRRREATPQGDYWGTLETIRQLVLRAERERGETGSVGIGTPGAISRASGRLKNSNSVCLNGQPLIEDLERVLGRPVRIANDADCFALSEASDGAAAGLPVVFGVILGTGVGGGIVVHGRLLQGPNAIAGEWGHNPLPWPVAEELPGPECYCGKRGCIETFLSGPGLARDFFQHTGQSLTGPEILARADSGDAAANAAFQRYEDRLARGLAQVINLLDPDAIVLGGGLSNCARLYDEVPKRWGRYVFSDRVDTRLLPPRHGDSSGVRGAAWLWG
jgi:predicted NBD/HSP70 family sugar kinase